MILETVFRFGVRLKSFMPTLARFCGLCRLFRERIETIEGDFVMIEARLDEAARLLLSLGPG